MIEGDLPEKAQSLVKEWLSSNASELQNMWDAYDTTDDYVEVHTL